MKKFDIELSCDNQNWWRFNVYFNIICLDANGLAIEHYNKMDEPYKINTNSLTPPLDYPAPRTIHLQTPLSSKISLYLYIIANSLPQNNTIRDLKPIPAQLNVSTEGKLLFSQSLDIDQFGGFTIAGQEISL